MVSDKTRDTLKRISDTINKGIIVSDAVADMLHAAGIDVAAYPADVLNMIAATLVTGLPDLYEKAADALGLNEHITIEVPEEGAAVTGEIKR